MRGRQRFADVVGDTGIVVDHQPSDSPAQLAAGADAVFGGELTGRASTTEMVSPDDPNPWSFVGFEIDVTRVVKDAEGVEVGQPVEVFIEYGPAVRPDIADESMRVAAGVPVVVFAGHRGDLGEFTAFVPEGFMTACEDGPLLGQTGTQGEWLDLDGLAAVLDAVETDASTATTAPAVVDATTTTGGTSSPSATGPSPLPDRPATVTGIVGTDEAGRPGFLEGASDSYYAGMGLSRGDPIVVDSATGQPVPFGSLRGGERISVWVDGGCAESAPVQCDIEAIAVHRAP